MNSSFIGSYFPSREGKKYKTKESSLQILTLKYPNLSFNDIHILAPYYNALQHNNLIKKVVNYLNNIKKLHPYWELIEFSYYSHFYYKCTFKTDIGIVNIDTFF